MSTPSCVLIENGRCYHASWAEASRADARRNPGTAQEYVASWLGEARDRVDAFVQEKGRNPFLKIGARGVAVPLAFFSAVADTALSVVGDLAPSVHAMVSGKVSMKQVVVAVGDTLVETAVAIPTAYREIVVGDHPANATYAAYCGILDSYMILAGGAGVIRGGMTLAGRTLAPIRRVAEGAADAVANTTMGGGMGMVTSTGTVFADGRAIAAPVAASGGWPAGLWGLAAMSEAVGEGRSGSGDISVKIETTEDLRTMLKSRNATQRQLAEYLGVKPSTVFSWFNHGHIPARYLAQINNFFNGSPPLYVPLAQNVLVTFVRNVLAEDMRVLIKDVTPTSAPNKFTAVTTDGRAYEVVVTGTVRELK